MSAAIAVGLFAASVRGDDTSAGQMRNVTDLKFEAFPRLPDCAAFAVMNGDPAKTPSMILAKVKAGCAIPWHWHSANEHVMMVSGSGRMEMKDMGKPTVLTAGGYSYLPSKHVHQLKCTAECMLYVYSEGPFDIHYVDPQGKEIEMEKALGKPAKSAER